MYNMKVLLCLQSYSGEKTSKFRIATVTTASGMWDVKRVRVYDTTGAELEVKDYFDSGSAPYEDYHVRQAFTDNTYYWGGR